MDSCLLCTMHFNGNSVQHVITELIKHFLSLVIVPLVEQCIVCFINEIVRVESQQYHQDYNELKCELINYLINHLIVSLWARCFQGVMCSVFCLLIVFRLNNTQ